MARNLVTVLLLASSVASCGGPEKNPNASDENSSTSNLIDSGDDLTLPIDVFLVRSADDSKVIQAAWEVEIDRCMGNRGLTYAPYPDGRPTSPLDPTIRYGLISIHTAEQFGYHNPDAEMDAAAESKVLKLEADREAQGTEYLNALYGTEQSGDDGTFTTTGGCIDEADTAIWGDAGGLPGLAGYKRVIDLQTTSNDALYTEDAGREAVAEWSACMIDSGHQYSAWWEPRQEFPVAAADFNPPSKEERIIATADAQCRVQTRLEFRLASAEREILKELMKPDAELYDSFRDEIGAVVSRASDILSDS